MSVIEPGRSGYGRIRRGPMAGDAFTQIRNAVFRDPRLSAKAMGIFGNISTHRDGWGITPEGISKQMRDGVGAIKAGLRELEKCGYLQRQRERRPDGTLGTSVYFITDQPEALAAPEAETPRSEPEGDFPPEAEPPQVEPPEAEPTVGDPPYKKIKGKKTRVEEDSVRPYANDPQSASEDAPPDDGGTDRQQQPSSKEHRQEPPGVDPVQRNEGVELLLSVAAEHPEYMLTGRTLRDQGLMVMGMIDAGWTTAQIRHIVTSRPLPEHLTHTVGAIVSRRLRDAVAAGPPPAAAASAGRPGLPEWCGQCGDGSRTAEFNANFRTIETSDGRTTRCPRCHPGRAGQPSPVPSQPSQASEPLLKWECVSCDLPKQGEQPEDGICAVCHQRAEEAAAALATRLDAGLDGGEEAVAVEADAPDPAAELRDAEPAADEATPEPQPGVSTAADDHTPQQPAYVPAQRHASDDDTECAELNHRGAAAARAVWLANRPTIRY